MFLIELALGPLRAYPNSIPSFDDWREPFEPHRPGIRRGCVRLSFQGLLMVHPAWETLASRTDRTPSLMDQILCEFEPTEQIACVKSMD
jgi:hypothetical protein